MNVWQSIFLGFLQGLTEFLPVSSSGHLILAEKILGIGEDTFLNVMLHLATLLAVIAVMRKQIAELFKFKNGKMLKLIIATLPTLAIAAVIKIFVSEDLLNGLLPIGFALTVVLLISQHFFAKPRLLSRKPLICLAVGAVQGIAVLPGLSRSGSTIAAMSLFGFTRNESAEFSFLLSIPVIICAAAVEIYEVAFTAFTISWINLTVALICAFVSSIVSLRLMLKIVKRAKLWYFALYLLIPLTLSLLIM